ncbi:DNA-binding protein [Ignicoccus islandicus DSM 13165]|uniref:Transcription elongation factor Spt4 n=1 Tax=Ignicoccus islandicus DSM 13165 TaxID=940295 RepID=A0A0U3E956_9CREN|nr:transcription elongation factor subunit Spt4 [Ignicoccus islandicus]ALU11870.1 DNA-binding protein [Ignicoccus islandicus DSM 13165]
MRRKPFVACMNCKALLPRGTERCPYCGSTEITENWDGVVIIISEESELIGKTEYLKKPGRYAVEVSASE